MKLQGLRTTVRAAAAAVFPSLLAVRPRHDARGARRGAGRRGPGVPGQAQLRLRLAPARRRGRGRRELSAMRCGANWRRRDGSRAAASRCCTACSSTATSPAATMSRSMWSGISRQDRPARAQPRDRRLRLLRRRRFAGGDDPGHKAADRRSARSQGADRHLALGTSNEPLSAQAGRGEHKGAVST